ncbi:MAG: PqqD family protein [Deltaproteobacteria bacterium]|nr:PqqD family protein [Deltaproteobacteria bacterium]
MTLRRRRKEALFSELPDGTGVVLHLDKRVYYPLSKTGVLLWHLYDVEEGVDDERLVSCLVQRFAIDEATARADVDAFVERLVNEEILITEPPPR